MNNLPRNMPLKAFDPHRASFECKHEADHVPPIDPEAEQWLQQGLTLTSQTLWADQRDYKRALQLWQKAADRHHWKAMLNLANAYAQGEGVERDTERAVQLVETAMQLGIPAAYDLMGTYHMNGTGVVQDSSRAYAFWELAADMGSPAAMAYLGSKMDAIYDDPPNFWGNRRIALEMLECGFAQGNGAAAYRLGGTIQGTRPELDEDNARALAVLHEGVKFGSAKSAIYLYASFDDGDAMVNHVKDPARGERYSVLADALERDPDLRLPNLDKILPLPPAPLPKWDGNKKTLIDAAKALVPMPPPPPAPTASAASQRTGRAHIPDGWILPDKPQVAVQAQWETVSAPESGYWIARLLRPVTEHQHAWNAAQVPLRYQRGELFDRTRPGLLDEDGRIQFHYLGQPIEQPSATPRIEDPRVARGIARYGKFPEPARRCRGHVTCPKTGIWAASVASDHTTAQVFNQWDRQSYLLEGQRFPETQLRHFDINAHDVVWHWLGQPNEVRAGGIVHIHLVSAEEVTAPTDKANTSISEWAGIESQPGKAAPSRRPLGAQAMTGEICPQTGWWQSQDVGLTVQGGRRHFFRAGESMAGIMLLGKGSVWQQLRGTSPTHPANTVWKLVDYETRIQQAAAFSSDEKQKDRT